MATKQEIAIKSAVTREKKKGIIREEKHMLWFLIAIILFLLYLLWAQAQGWWPFLQPKLGTAFYTNVSAAAPDQPASGGDSNGSGGNNSGGSGGGGTTNPGGNNGGGGGGGTTTPPASSSGILDLAANVNVGDSKSQVNGHANGLGSGCAVVVDANGPTVGKQEVCTYSQGNKIVTVTYLNDQVVSASKSGF
jgi:hypothetical protein